MSQNDAIQLGYQSFWDGYELDANPYGESDPKHGEFLLGWRKAEIEESEVSDNEQMEMF